MGVLILHTRSIPRSAMHLFHNGESRYTDIISCNFRDDDSKLFVLGGDGTFLRAVGSFGFGEIPMVYAFGGGRMGFLLPLALDRLQELVPRIKAGHMKTTRRFRLHVCTHKELVSNELVVRSDNFRLNEFRITIDGHTFCVRASEVIVSTRSGSSGYNCSLGGPLMFVEGMVINCTAPNRCNFRTLVLSLDSRVSIDAPGCSGYFDGVPRPGETFHISKGDSYEVAVDEDYSEHGCIDKVFYSSPYIQLSK